MAVEQLDPADKGELNRFIRMERELVGDQPLFVGDLDSDVRKHLSGRSEFSQGVEFTLFANAGARCAAIVNPRWQQSHDEPQTGHVGYFAAAPDASEQAAEVLAAAEDRLGRQGMTRAIAPFNGNAFQGMGILTDAFDEPPMFPLPWTPPYYERYLTAAGYGVAYPLWVYEVDFDYERYRDFSQRALESPECAIRQIDKGRWDEEVETLRLIWNEGFGDEWEFHQFTAAQFSEFFKAVKPTLDPRIVLIAEAQGEPAGLAWGMPDLNPALRATHGRLGPIKLLRLMHAARRPSRIGLLAIAVRPQFRGRRIGAALAASLYRELQLKGFGKSLYYPVNDANAGSRGLAEALGGEGRLLYHCYDKDL